MIPDIVKVVRYFITNFKGRMGAGEEKLGYLCGRSHGERFQWLKVKFSPTLFVDTF